MITPVDFDHEQFLGRSLEAIAGEKAGILKPGVPAVFAQQRPEAAAVLERRAAELGDPGDLRRGFGRPRPRSSMRAAAGSANRRSPDRVPAGRRAPGRECRHGRRRAARPRISRDARSNGASPPRAGRAAWSASRSIRRSSWTARTIPAGARALAAYIDRFYSGRRVRLIFGAMRDKAIDEIGGILFPRAEEVILTAPRQARALSPEALRDVVDHPNVRVAPTIVEALEHGPRCGAGRRGVRHRLAVPGRGGAGYNRGSRMSLLRSLLISTPLIILSTVVMGTLSLIASLFDGSGHSQHRLARLWAKSLLAFSFIRVRVEGLENLDPNASYVFVSNHESLMDIPAILSALPFQFRFFAKKGLFGIPFLGTHLKRAGHLPVDRSNARAFAQKHERGRPHRGGARGLGVVVSGRRAVSQGPAGVQGRRGVHRHQGGRAGGADGDHRNAPAAADGVDPHSLRPRAIADRDADRNRRHEACRSRGADAPDVRGDRGAALCNCAAEAPRQLYIP